MTDFRPAHSQRGSVVLVAMCFLAVLGIALASYLAVSNQALKLSNRSYLAGVSEQVAEMGLEQTLWAFNHNNWSAWSIDTTTIPGTVIAKRTISFASSKYGNGTITSINLRVDNYNAPATATEWDSATTYSVGAIVSHRNISPWNSSAAYVVDDIVTLTNTRYRCILAHAGQSPPSAAHWVATTDFEDFRSWYRCIGNNTAKPPSNSTYWTRCTPIIYAEGVVAPLASSGAAIKTQLRAAISIAPLFPNAVAAASTLTFATGTVDSYDSDTDADPSTPAIDFSAAASTYSAILAGGNTSSTAVTVNDGTVQGYVAAPPATSTPHNPLFAYGPTTTVKGPTSSVNVDLTRVSRNPYIPQFDARVWDSASGYSPNDVVRFSGASGKFYLYKGTWPSPLGDPTSSATNWRTTTKQINLATEPIINPTGTAIKLRYTTADLSLPASSDILTIDCPVIIDVQGDLSIGLGAIIVSATGSAEIHVSGQIQVESGGSIQNITKDPKKLLLVRSTISGPLNGHYIKSNTPFYGTIYMPYSSLTLDTNTVILGAVSANNVTFSGNNTLHYDTSLRTATFHSIDTPYVITDWRELTDPAERVTLP